MNNNDKRTFPRIDAQCPVLYRFGTGPSWKVAKMMNISATGILMICPKPQPLDTPVEVHVKPGSRKMIPEIRAEGKVLRCEQTPEDEYLISCRFHKVRSD